MRAFYCDDFDLPLPDKHRFPVEKYRLLRQRVEQQAKELGIELLVPLAATDKQLSQIHTPEYLDRVFHGRLSKAEQRRIGFPWSPQLVERSRRSTGGTIAAASAALRDLFSVNLAGGTHHAFADRGQGYCVFNDVAVAARFLLDQRRISSALVIDCDVHQGNGTASIFAGDDSVFTVSLHGDRNFPFNKVAGDVDIALPDGSDDDHYLDALETCLGTLPRNGFDVAFYLSGADPFRGDRLGKLSLTKAGLGLRDQMVLSYLAQQKIPAAITMAGGYAPNLHDIVDIHMETVRLAAELGYSASCVS